MVLPDFFVGGAPKCGSTTLHALLDQHPKIEMSDKKEITFFDRDDIWTHSNYALRHFQRWKSFSIDGEEEWENYAERFSESDRLKAESTPTYIYSKKAAKRASEYLNDAKAVFILRDPVERIYSLYWHNLGVGRTFHTFEKTLLNHPQNIERSIYPPFIENWQRELGEENIHIVLLEELIDRPQETANSIFKFLGLDEQEISLPEKNKGTYPRFPIFIMLFNLYSQFKGKDTSHRPLIESKIEFSFLEKVYRKLFMLNSLMETDQKPEMDEEIRKKLESIFLSRE